MEGTGLLFQGWEGVLRVVVVGLLAYPALVVVLRVSGKRTLAKLNAFDLVVTVAIGSTLATILLSRDVALAEGVTAFLVLVGLQYAVAALSVRWPGFSRAVRSEPTLVLRDGQPLEAALRRSRVTREELAAVVRAAGDADLEGVDAVVLESDGSFSVVRSKGE